MHDMVERIDDYGKPAWIGLMVLGFILFWPVGLLILAFLLWSGRMGCKGNTSWRSRFGGWEDKVGRWGREGRWSSSTGNYAFDEYREATLKRLEEEAHEFRSFLDKLRMAKDRAEFEQFMNDRRSAASPPGSTTPSTPAA